MCAAGSSYTRRSSSNEMKDTHRCWQGSCNCNRSCNVERDEPCVFSRVTVPCCPCHKALSSIGLGIEPWLLGLPVTIPMIRQVGVSSATPPFAGPIARADQLEVYSLCSLLSVILSFCSLLPWSREFHLSLRHRQSSWLTDLQLQGLFSSS